MSNSSLVNYINISPNKTSPRTDLIDTLTIHHAATVKTTAKKIADGFANTNRGASANYCIGYQRGDVALSVEEKDRSWCSGTGMNKGSNDQRAITIEVSNDGGEPNWHVSDDSIATLIDLCVDICKRNGKNKVVWIPNKEQALAYILKSNEMKITVHQWFQATACPGAYLMSKMQYIADEINKGLNKTNAIYVGYLDTATTSAISGWAWNSIDDTALQVDIQISKDNKVVKTLTTTANIYRADLLNAKKGNGKHGFSVNFDFNTLGAGTYTVKAYTNGKQLTNVKSVVVKESTSTPTVSSNTTYTVVKGDSYYGIAKKLGDVNRYKEIQTLNNNKALFAGDVILVPSDMGKTTSATPSAKDTFIKDLRSALGLSSSTTVTEIFAKTPTLTNNNKYNKVTVVVQTYLNALGFNCGTADGYFGNNTENAVKAYQKKYTGIVDGVMSAKGKMWKHMLGV